MTREEAIKDIQDNILPIVGGKSLAMAISALRQPDIIHCKDCKHYIRHDKRCGYWNHGVKPTMWCSQAERLLIGENYEIN